MEITSGLEWRRPREQGYPIKLPSGHVALVRPVDFGLFIKLGKLPDVLTPFVEELLVNSGVKMKEVIGEYVSDKSVLQLWKENRGIQESFAEVAFVNPRIVESPVEEDEIAIQDLSTEDLSFIVQLMNVPADELKRFSEEQNLGLEPVADQPVDQSIAEPDIEPEPMASE